MTLQDHPGPRQVLLLSARSQSALDAATANLADHFRRNPDMCLADAAFTLQEGRRAFSHRRMVVCASTAEAVEALDARSPARVSTRTAPDRAPEVAFLFPGQGAQYVNMGANLYEEEPLFRETVDLCAELLMPHLGRDLREVLYPAEGDAEAAAALLRETFYTQPTLFAIEYALARLWISWGVRPAAMIGHSIGEYVAACLADVFELKDALMLVAARGRLMRELPAGAMLSVRLPAAELTARLASDCAIAAVNGPTLCVVAGPTETVAALQRRPRGSAGRLQASPHVPRFPFPDDGPHHRTFYRVYDERAACTPADSLRVYCHGGVDHAGTGDGSAVLVETTAANGPLCRRGAGAVAESAASIGGRPP